MIPYDRNYQFDGPSDNFSSRSSSTADRTESSPMIDEQPALHEAEAREKFRSSPPPFAVKKRGQKKSKQILFATADGRYPDKEYYATAFTRRWNDEYVFWTLEMKTGELYIIKAFSGASRGGCSYRLYTGGEHEFHPTAVAFSVPGISQDQKNDTPPKEKQPNGLRAEDRSSVPRSTRRSMGLDRTSLLPYLHRRDKDSTSNPGSLLAHDTLPSNPRAPQARDTKSVNDEFPDIFPEAPVTCMSSRKRTRPISESEDSNSNDLYGVSPRGQRRKFEKTNDPLQFQVQQPTTSALKSLQPGPEAPSPPILSSSTLKFTLPPEKIARTTLFVRLSPSSRPVPLFLSSCMTVASFYTLVTNECGIKEEDLGRVEVNFGWDRHKGILMSRNQTDTFHWFLMTIDEAPCWDKNKRCEVDVEVFVKDKKAR